MIVQIVRFGRNSHEIIPLLYTVVSKGIMEDKEHARSYHRSSDISPAEVTSEDH